MILWCQSTLKTKQLQQISFLLWSYWRLSSFLVPWPKAKLLKWLGFGLTQKLHAWSAIFKNSEFSVEWSGLFRRPTRHVDATVLVKKIVLGRASKEDFWSTLETNQHEPLLSLHPCNVSGPLYFGASLALALAVGVLASWDFDAWMISSSCSSCRTAVAIMESSMMWWQSSESRSEATQVFHCCFESIVL